MIRSQSQSDSNSDSDDDFQSPTHGITVNRTVIHSEINNSRSERPLKDSVHSSARPVKKPRSSSASAEKVSLAKCLIEKVQPVFLVPITCKGVEESDASESRILVDTNGSSRSAGFHQSTLIRPREGEKENILRSRCTDIAVESQKHVEALNTEVLRSESSGLCLEVDSNPCSAGAVGMSIEDRLVAAGKVPSFLGEDDIASLEGGTQLHNLINLCVEIGDREDLDAEGEFTGRDYMSDGEITWQSDGRIECPLCSVDITHLSEEQRHTHSNDCLDNKRSQKVPLLEDTHDDKDSHPFKSASDVSQVLEFLRNIGLSKYEDVFVKEEIDWNTLQWLKEEDLLSIGIVSLGPRKKIAHALQELRDEKNMVDNTSKLVRQTTESTRVSHGNKLITEYFQGTSVNISKISAKSKPPIVLDHCRKEPKNKNSSAKNYSGSSKFKDLPSWCSIPGTPFRVDAFRFLRGDCSHWFLTHFHNDHYQGLTRNFRHGKIYCSSITATLVNIKIGIPLERLHILPLNSRTNIAGVDITFLDANHCPGSVIILFEPPNGRAVLHTGDFRFCEAMTNCSILQSCRVHTLILDTTYCNPLYDFPKQEAVIQFVIEAIQAETFNPKTLFLIGSYTIGKERIFCEIARFLRKKIFVGASKLTVLQCLDLPVEDMQWFTSNEMESNIHVVPMWSIASFKRMKHLTNQYSGRYNLIVAFSPTGWSIAKGRKRSPGAGRKWQQGTIIRYEVPYSEHSSFSELQEFVKFISPEVIIPSVNNNDKKSADTMVSLLTSNTVM